MQRDDLDTAELAALQEELERALDDMEPAAYPMWRHRAVGTDVATAMSRLPDYGSVKLKMPRIEFVAFNAAALARGITAPLLRQIVAEWCADVLGASAADMPWLMHHGYPAEP
jgi:hypothetical protein